MSELRDTELRDLLERVADLDGDVDVERSWAAGRRRRAQRRAGIGALAVISVAAVALALGTGGLLGGQNPTPTGPAAAVPDDLETFVFVPRAAEPAAPVGTVDPSAELSPATAAELSGTSWVLQDGLWSSATPAADLTGSDAETTLVFGDVGERGGWGLSIGGCGDAAVQGLVLDERGRFVDPAVRTNDMGCPDDVQTAEDFWIAALQGGGQLTVVGDAEWLLLSVDAPETDAATDEPETAAPTTTGSATATATDDGTGTPDDEGTAAPSGTTSPPASTAPPVQPPPTVPPAAEGFTAPEEVAVGGGWPGGGGALLAPTVRAGVHDGFDRVVVDLTGTGEPGWRAAYTDDPRLDGSGLPADIAGDSVLQVTLAGMGYPEPGSEVYDEGIFGLDTHTLSAVVEVWRTPPFEGQLQLFVGMQGEPRPYRVFLLQNPLRLVVDVQTAP